MSPSTDSITVTTGSTLASLGVLHLAWGRGSTWPYADLEALHDNVIGRPVVPSPGACFAVAGLLGTAAALVAVPVSVAPRLRTTGRLCVAAVLATRATLGFLGRTDLVSPGSSSPAFRRNDRLRFSPLCAALALGAAHTAWQGAHQGRVSGAPAPAGKVQP